LPKFVGIGYFLYEATRRKHEDSLNLVTELFPLRVLFGVISWKM
jgi:hypothetical protein